MVLSIHVCEDPKGADVSALDQMTVTNIIDLEALDDFLNSTGDDISTGSSLTSGNAIASVSVKLY